MARVFHKIFETVIHVSRETFWGKVTFFREGNYSPFLEFERMFYDFPWKFFGRVVKNAFYVSRTTFDDKSFWEKFYLSSFLSFEQNLSDFCQTFSQACQICFSGVKRNSLRKYKFLKEVNLFTIFGIWAKICWTFNQSFLAGMSYLQSTCPVEHLREID